MTMRSVLFLLAAALASSTAQAQPGWDWHDVFPAGGGIGSRPNVDPFDFLDVQVVYNADGTITIKIYADDDCPVPPLLFVTIGEDEPYQVDLPWTGSPSNWQATATFTPPASLLGTTAQLVLTTICPTHGLGDSERVQIQF